MSVEIHGPKGYEVQYLVTLWVALVVYKAAGRGARLLVEGKEDAEIELNLPEGSSRIFIQSKHQAGRLDLETLSEWLMHFERFSDRKFLLRELLENENLLTVFATSARCADDTSGFIQFPGNLQRHNTAPLSFSNVKKFLALVRVSRGTKGSKLEKRRQDECGRFATITNPQQLQEVLQRVIVWEQLSKAAVIEEIEKALIELRVSEYAVTTTMLKLIDAVRLARDDRSNLIPVLHSIVEINKAERVLPVHQHTARGDEALLVRLFYKQRVLRLTGRSKVGKTHFGRFLLQYAQDQGATCLETDDVREAKRFLDRDVLKTRVVLLDDPLLVAVDPLRTWEAVSKLAEVCPPHHLLVVTAKLEQLLELDPSFNAACVDLFGGVWVDLTARDRVFLSTLWRALAENMAISTKVRIQINKYIETCDLDELLQPGQLIHLAYDRKGSDQVMTVQALLSTARYNSRELAARLAQDRAWKVVDIALAIGGTHRRGISLTELAFLCAETSQLPGLFGPERIRCYTFPGNDESGESELKFPSYEQPPQVTSTIEERLYALEAKGYLSVTGQQVFFVHPDYREAFVQRALFEKGSGAKVLFETVLRAFGSLDPFVGISAARFINLWLGKVGVSEEATGESVAELGLRAFECSIFPDVRSSVMLSLLNCISLLNRNQEQNLLKFALLSESESKALVWTNGKAWIHNVATQWIHDIFRTRRTLPESELLEAIQKVKQPGRMQELSGLEADAINTEYFRRRDMGERLGLDAEVLSALLDREEVYIRADAAEFVFAGGSSNFDVLVTKVFEDEHPMVVASGVLSAAQYWSSHSVQTMQRLRVLLVEGLEDPSVAALSSMWLCKLGDEYISHEIRWEGWSDEKKITFWKCWAEQMAVVFTTLSTRRFRLNVDVFWLSIQVCAKFAGNREMSKLCLAWTHWIEEQSKLRVINDYACGVIRLVFRTNKVRPSSRELIIRRILEIKETDIALDALNICIEHWKRLTSVERAAVVNLICAQREDQNWLRAAVLLQKVPPAELQQIVIGRDDFAALSAKEQCLVLESGLLTYCLQLFAQHLGYGFTVDSPNWAERRWTKILFEQFSSSTVDDRFRIAVTHLVNTAAHGANGRHQWIVLWRKLCATSEGQHQDFLFDALLCESLNHTGPKLEGFWPTFFENVSNVDRKRGYLLKLVNRIEGIGCRHDDFPSLLALLGGNLLNDIGKLLRTDDILVNLMSMYKRVGVSIAIENKESLFSLFKLLYGNEPPRVLAVHESFVEWLKEIPGHEFLSELLEAVRSNLLKKGHEQSNEHSAFRAEMHGWLVQSGL